MMSNILTFSFLVAALAVSSDATTYHGCRGSAKYKITFFNYITPARFGSAVPETGLVFSPLTAASHTGRISILTVRGFASRPVEDIAETGDNSRLVKLASKLSRKNQGVKDFTAATGPTMPANSTVLELSVDCQHSFVTVLGMVAPSPDWIVQISNKNLYSSRYAKFASFTWGYLIAYDAGTDSGADFTPPGDTSLDIPTAPKQNIAPLVEDETDPFHGKVIGKYTIVKM